MEGADIAGTGASAVGRGVSAAGAATGQQISARFVSEPAEGQKAMETLIEDGCNLQVVFGSSLEAGALKLANSHRQVRFVLVGMSLRAKDVPENVKPVVFDLSVPAWQAGYASAAYTRTKKIGLVAGAYNDQSATLLANFSAGIGARDTANSKQKPAQANATDKGEGYYLGAQAAYEQGEEAGRQLYKAGADVIVAAASEQANKALVRALKQKRDETKKVKVIVLSPSAISKEQAANLIVATVEPRYEVALKNLLVSSIKNGFSSARYIANAQNGGVGISLAGAGEGEAEPFAKALESAKQRLSKGQKLLVKPDSAPGQISATAFAPPTEASKELDEK
ncbi:hypothetical protein HMPREF3152_03990 [Actinomyces sp. HMSC06A08]|nr:hypothetical protein HMPREF2851_06865 [Actinomyces sp. HMSC064C12]OFT55823.1 hypothetical protein HMPREF3152_03990 [Actinomyces sp. HMSC06A08]